MEQRMNSPFPGVDPYLESQHYWPEFHSRFINAWCEAIAERLPDHYEARLDEQVQVMDLQPRDNRLIRPDVAIVHQGERTPARQAASVVATLEGVTLDMPELIEVREEFIQIFHRPERALVAVLELLSPANKANPGRGIYLKKRNEIRLQPVHLVELDLLISGDRLPMRQPLPSGDFYALVSRALRPRTAIVYAWTLRARLPVIPIPLLTPDPDIGIDLAAVFATAYQRGHYQRSIDYAANLPEPWSKDDQAWAAQIIASGKR
jgi:hypothetical protein